MKLESFMFSALDDLGLKLTEAYAFFSLNTLNGFWQILLPNVELTSLGRVFFTSEHHFETASLMEINV